MRHLRDLSIQTKLSLIGVLASGLAVGLACAGFVITDVRRIKSSTVEHLVALASLVGAESTAALRFDDAIRGQEVPFASS